MSVTGGPKIVTDGLVLSLDAANPKSYPGSGTTWTDLSGNGNNGTLTNGPTFSSGNLGSISFDGVNDYSNGTISTNGLSTGNSSHSIDMWFRLNSYGTTRSWIFVLGQYSTGAHHWILSSETNTQFGIWAGSQLSPSISLNTWTNISITYDRVNLVGYKNGLFDSSVTATNEINFTNTNYNIGLRVNSSESYMNGLTSNLRIYNRALTASEVLQNYNATKGRFGL